MKTDTLNIFHQKLLKWYEIYGRKQLPWRNLKGKNAPYGVYVSEIMLQQTQVATVLGKYYEPFLSKFPTLKDLSLAEEDEVLYLWRGLGYYSRARNLLKSARICRNSLPSEPKELMRLPGIGVYTAGAIACFGFKKAVGFVDGNIRRVLSRLFGLKNPSISELQKYAEKILNHQDSFNHNQALLDIGAIICTPTSPKCYTCPLQDYCIGKENPLNYAKKSKIIYEKLEVNLGVYIQEGKIALSKSQSLLYKGMYGFPKIKNNTLMEFPLIGLLKHSYTRYKLSLKVYLMPSDRELEDNIEFFSVKELDTLPISGMTLKVLKLINQKGVW